MSIKQELLSYLKNNKNRFQNDYQLKELYLFGSVAIEKDTPTSDIDLIVKFDGDMNFTKLFGIKHELEDKFHKKVDLLEFDAIKPELKKYIIMEKI
jgi:predicted nucleotidyltransferase